MFLLQAGADKEPTVNNASIRLGFRDSELALTNPRFRKQIFGEARGSVLFGFSLSSTQNAKPLRGVSSWGPALRCCEIASAKEATSHELSFKLLRGHCLGFRV